MILLYSNIYVGHKQTNKMFDRNNNSRGFAPREMIKGNWKCSECAVEITELPLSQLQTDQSTAENAGQRKDHQDSADKFF